MVAFTVGNVTVFAPVSVETAKTVAVNLIKNINSRINSSDKISLVYDSEKLIEKRGDYFGFGGLPGKNYPQILLDFSIKSIYLCQ